MLNFRVCFGWRMLLLHHIVGFFVHFRVVKPLLNWHVCPNLGAIGVCPVINFARTPGKKKKTDISVNYGGVWANFCSQVSMRLVCFYYSFSLLCNFSGSSLEVQFCIFLDGSFGGGLKSCCALLIVDFVSLCNPGLFGFNFVFAF